MSRSGSEPRRVTVLSVEQALAMPYATLRMVHQGFRVIRVEPTPGGGRAVGDPNRHIGRPVVAGEPDDRRSYFVAPNAGKEAIAIDLKQPEGRALLLRLIEALGVDVFCTNTLPAHHTRLGIDHRTLAAARPELIWCAISALGLAHPDVPGYDPVLQALCGYMDLTGAPDGPPTQCGPPIIDLKAGDEAFTQVALALLDRTSTGHGRTIDVSMAQAALSWLLTFLPMLELGSPPAELRRSGNEHRQFIPTNAYPTRDGFVYLAIGSDLQWARLTAEPAFAALARPELSTNEGRRERKVALHAEIGGITARLPTTDVDAALRRAGIPHAPITPIEKVMELPFAASALLRTLTPDGREVRLPPPATSTPYLDSLHGRLPFAPRYGEHTDALLREAGVAAGEIESLRAGGVVA